MHRISIIGLLTNRPILSCNGELSANFAVEVTSDTKSSETIIYDVIAYGTNARFVNSHADAGTEVMVLGIPIIKNKIPGARVTIKAILVRIVDSLDLKSEHDVIHQYHLNMQEA